MKWALHADISPEAFFRFQWAGSIGNSPVVSPAVYLDAIDGLDVHRWLNGVIRPMPKPEADWTLGQLEELAASLATARTEIQGCDRRAEALAGLVATSRNQSLQELLAGHRKAVSGYLRAVGEGLARIEQGLRGGVPTSQPDTVERVLRGLDQHIRRLVDASRRPRDAST